MYKLCNQTLNHTHTHTHTHLHKRTMSIFQTEELKWLRVMNLLLYILFSSQAAAAILSPFYFHSFPHQKLLIEIDLSLKLRSIFLRITVYCVRLRCSAGFVIVLEVLTKLLHIISFISCKPWLGSCKTLSYAGCKVILLVLKCVIHSSVVKHLRAMHSDEEGMVVELQAAKPVTMAQDWVSTFVSM